MATGTADANGTFLLQSHTMDSRRCLSASVRANGNGLTNAVPYASDGVVITPNPIECMNGEQSIVVEMRPIVSP